MSFQTRFIGSNVLTNELGPDVKEMTLEFKEGEPIMIPQDATGTVKGECYEILVTFLNGTVRRYNAMNDYTFKEHVASKATMREGHTRVSIIGDSGVGGNFELVTRSA
ncbi:hypothetical protein A9K55_004403 [Cordyceps militaris]|uniref:Uncharacterized protein n=1 Tax=Cordyceps militaris TaxID=73501 RepID=A0A2H4SL79_CORMI|nr:hypothetical protein A9K55_004403 [Cordyceps militaris]